MIHLKSITCYKSNAKTHICMRYDYLFLNQFSPRIPMLKFKQTKVHIVDESQNLSFFRILYCVLQILSFQRS